MGYNTESSKIYKPVSEMTPYLLYNALYLLSTIFCECPNCPNVTFMLTVNRVYIFGIAYILYLFINIFTFALFVLQLLDKYISIISDLIYYFLLTIPQCYLTHFIDVSDEEKSG